MLAFFVYGGLFFMNESFEFLYKNFNIIAESAAIIFLGIVLYLLTKKFISKLFAKFKEKIDTRKYKTFQIACNSIIKYIIFFVIICMFFNVLGILMLYLNVKIIQWQYEHSGSFLLSQH